MIDPKELRVGNLIIVSNKALPSECEGVIKVHRILEDRVRYYAPGQSEPWHERFYNCEPIPLTEELLQKIGFEIEADNPSYKIFWLSLQVEGFQIQYYRSLTSKRLYISGNGGYEFSGELDLTQKVTSLHQLQNLYFALTQKELELS